MVPQLRARQRQRKKKKKAKGTDDSELDLEALKANAASKKKIQKLAKKGRLSEVGKVLEALPTPFEDTEQKKAKITKAGSEAVGILGPVRADG